MSEVVAKQVFFPQDDPMTAQIWKKRAQEMMQAVGPYLGGDMEKLTAGWVLQAFHEQHGEVAESSKTAIGHMLFQYRGFQLSHEGFYHYEFIARLELVCKATREAMAHQLLDRALRSRSPASHWPATSPSRALP